MTSGQGLRLVVAALIATSPRVGGLIAAHQVRDVID